MNLKELVKDFWLVLTNKTLRLVNSLNQPVKKPEAATLREQVIFPTFVQKCTK